MAKAAFAALLPLILPRGAGKAGSDPAELHQYDALIVRTIQALKGPLNQYFGNSGNG